MNKTQNDVGKMKASCEIKVRYHFYGLRQFYELFIITYLQLKYGQKRST